MLAVVQWDYKTAVYRSLDKSHRLPRSGQSGSGKTEATKLIVHYLSSTYRGRADRLRQVPSVHRSSTGRPPTRRCFLVSSSSSSPSRCFPSWRVSETPRPSSMATPAGLANTFTFTSSGESDEDRDVSVGRMLTHRVCWQWGCRGNLVVQISPGEVSGRLPGKNTGFI